MSTLVLKNFNCNSFFEEKLLYLDYDERERARKREKEREREKERWRTRASGVQYINSVNIMNGGVVYL